MLPSSADHRRSAAIYFILAAIYLVYLPHAQFVLDDWYVLGRYQAAREDGFTKQVEVFRLILQNEFHGQFRFQWISFSLGYLMWLLAGYSPKVVFIASVLLHAGCAIALRAALERLGVGSQVAFLSGAAFIFLPTTHEPVLWSFNCAFFLWSTLWFLLYVRSLARTLQTGRLERRQFLFLLLALFSGDPIFGLLASAAPLAGWYMRSRNTVRATLSAWATIAVAAGVYVLLLNRAPLVGSGFGLRYDFSAERMGANLATIAGVYRKLTGFLPDSYYRLTPTIAVVLGAMIAAGAVACQLRRLDSKHARVLRLLLLAAGLWVAAYAPVLFLRGHEHRYDYVPSPYLALALATLVAAVPVARTAFATALAAWLAAASVADVEQSWIPQSREVRAVAERLRSLPRVAAGDVIIVPDTPVWIGSAPNFAFLAGWASTPFAQRVTGVRGVEAACDVVEEDGRLRVYHRDYIRDFKPDEPARTRVLARDGDRRVLAQQVGPEIYRLYALKDYAGPRLPEHPVTRDQLAMLEHEIYFVKRFSHH